MPNSLMYNVLLQFSSQSANISAKNDTDLKKKGNIFFLFFMDVAGTFYDTCTANGTSCRQLENAFLINLDTEYTP